MRTAKHSHAHSQAPSLADALQRIEASDYRLTKPRRALLEAIFKLKKPVSAPELEKRLSGKKDGCDAVTIYRSLPVFVELGILEKCDFSEDVTHYEISHGHHEGHHHHHVVCTSCKRVDPLEACLIENQEALLKRLGYKNLKHRLEFSGLCPSCV